jgi:hypothetical protein
MWEPRRLTTLWAFMAYYRDSFTIYITIHFYCTYFFNSNHPLKQTYVNISYLSTVGLTWKLLEQINCESWGLTVHSQRNMIQLLGEQRKFEYKHCAKHILVLYTSAHTLIFSPNSAQSAALSHHPFPFSLSSVKMSDWLCWFLLFCNYSIVYP